MVPFQKLSEELQQKIAYDEFPKVLPTIAELISIRGNTPLKSKMIKPDLIIRESVKIISN